MAWIGNILLIIGYLLVGNKVREAFIFTFVGEILWSYYALKKKEWALLAICLIFAVIAVRNWFLWGA